MSCLSRCRRAGTCDLLGRDIVDDDEADPPVLERDDVGVEFFEESVSSQ